MEQEGSLRNSHRETTQVKRKVAPKAVQEKARDLVNRASEAGVVIRQHLDIERMKQPLQKGVFYVAENEGNAEPGFLVFLPGTAPVFLQMKKHAYPPCTLRMRVSPELGEGGGSVFIATFDTIQHTLRLEDVWMWKGSSVFDYDPYSKRRHLLKEFVEKYWIPDTRLLGGVVASVLNPLSVDVAFSKAFTGIHTIDLIPESPGKRRMWIECDGSNTVKPKPSTPVAKSPVAKAPVAKSPLPDEFTAHAKPVEALPDIYDLYDASNNLLGRGSVQTFSVSKALKGHTNALVKVRWNKEFSGYEIFSMVE
jgi:hypothetical protein